MNPTAFEYGATFIENACAAERIETDAECEVQDDYCTGNAEWLVGSQGYKSVAAVISCQRCATGIWLHPKANDLDLFAVSEEAISEYEDVVDRFVPIDEYDDSDSRLERRLEHYPDEPVSHIHSNQQ